MKGVYINIGKKGASLSVGAPGARVTMSSRGTTSSMGIPGSGISHTHYEPHAKPKMPIQQGERGEVERHGIGFALALGLFLFPIVFCWFLLRKEYTASARLAGFSYALAIAAIFWGATHQVDDARVSSPASLTEPELITSGKTAQQIESEIMQRAMRRAENAKAAE